MGMYPYKFVILDSQRNITSEINLNTINKLISNNGTIDFPSELIDLSFSSDGKKIVVIAYIGKPYAFISDTEGKNIQKISLDNENGAPIHIAW